MRSPLLTACFLAGLMIAPTYLPAQSSDSSGGAQSSDARRQKMIGFLPQDEQDKVTDVYNKTMSDHPKLKSEDDALKQQGTGMQDASADDHQAFMEKVRAHREKVRAAMLKEDPTIAPILDKIDKHLSEMYAQRQKDMGGNGGGGSGQ